MIPAMTTSMLLLALFTLGVLIGLTVVVAREIDRDGYGLSPPPRSHPDDWGRPPYVW